jgi:nitrite reductase/ring-hydroxylating ferredoxin subunit
MGHEIEWPKHYATFDYRTGEARRPPTIAADPCAPATDGMA